MLRRQLGQSDLNVTAITLGAWAIGGWMWGGQETDDAIRAIDASIDEGIDTIDTAAVYGFGRSEEIVGRAVAGKRDKVRILTKYGLRWDVDQGEFFFDIDGNPLTVMRNSRPDSVIEECERSLRRLGTEYIDLYQCHWPDPTTPIEQTFGAIEKLLKQGKIRAAGVSNYTPEQMERARKVVPLASDQPPYSMVLRDIEDDVLPYCREHNIGVICYSPLQRGLLTGKITEDYSFDGDDHRKDNAFFQPGNIRRVNAFLDRIRPIAETHNATLAQLVINWTIHRPGITAALVGARNEKQARENARAARIELSEEETRTINELLAEVEIER